MSKKRLRIFAGPNGSGKTTLIRMLADVVNETSGSICVNGRDKKSMGEDYRELVGYLPQDVGFYNNFTAEKFLFCFDVNHLTFKIFFQLFFAKRGNHSPKRRHNCQHKHGYACQICISPVYVLP